MTEKYIAAIGGTDDAEATADGTMIALLKRLRTLLNTGLLTSATGDLSRVNVEWVLHTGTTYLFRVINRAGSAQPAGLILQWYEDSLG